MEVREELKELIEKAKDAAVAAGELPEGDYAPVQRLEVPKEKDFGDYSTNAAMQWARTAHKAPRMIADVIVKHMDTPLVSRMDIAGAGFINFFLAKDTVYTELKNIRPFLWRPAEGQEGPDSGGIRFRQSHRPPSYRPCPGRCLRFCPGEPASGCRL